MASPNGSLVNLLDMFIFQLPMYSILLKKRCCMSWFCLQSLLLVEQIYPFRNKTSREARTTYRGIKVENGRDRSRSVRNRLPFYPDRFRFSGKIRKRDRKQDGMHRDRDRKRDEGFSVHIYIIPFLTGIIPYSSRLQLIRDNLLACFVNMRPTSSAHLFHLTSVSCTLC